MSQYKKIVALMLIFASVQIDGNFGKRIRNFAPKAFVEAMCIKTLEPLYSESTAAKKDNILKEKQEYLIKKGLFTRENVPPVTLPVHKSNAYCAIDHIGISNNQCNGVLLHEAGHWTNNDVKTRIMLNFFTLLSVGACISVRKYNILGLFLTTFSPIVRFTKFNRDERRADNFACKHGTAEELINLYCTFSSYYAELNTNLIKSAAMLLDEHPFVKSRMIKVIDALVEKTTLEEMRLLLKKDILKNATDQNRDAMYKVADQYRQKLTDPNKIAILTVFIAIIQK